MQDVGKGEIEIIQAVGGPLSQCSPARAAGLITSVEAHLILFPVKGNKRNILSESC